MIAVPFIYFSLLSIILFLRHRKLDMATFISLLYAITGYFSILYYQTGATAGYSVSGWGAIAYCGLLTIMIVPIAIWSNAKISSIKPISNIKLFKFFAWIAFGYFVVWTLLSLNSIIDILTGDMAQARVAAHEGSIGAVWMGRLPGPIRLVFAFFNMMLGCSWIPIFLAFYSLSVLKLPKKIFVILILVSTMGPLNGIMGADRSATAYWIISLIACIIFFYPFLVKREKKWILSLSVIFVGLFSWYLSSMTTARFEDSQSFGGVEGSLISYFGQNYVFFCHFFDTFTAPQTTLEIIFPFTYHQILGSGFGSTVETQEYFTLLTGKATGVFYTFLGQIMFTAGKIPMTIYVFVVSICSLILLRRPRRTIANMKDCYLYLLFSSVLFLGIFTHQYAAAPKTFSAIFFFFATTYLCRTKSNK